MPNLYAVYDPEPSTFVYFADVAGMLPAFLIDSGFRAFLI